jgi:hypothetical protein
MICQPTYQQTIDAEWQTPEMCRKEVFVVKDGQSEWSVVDGWSSFAVQRFNHHTSAPSIISSRSTPSGSLKGDRQNPGDHSKPRDTGLNQPLPLQFSASRKACNWRCFAVQWKICYWDVRHWMDSNELQYHCWIHVTSELPCLLRCDHQAFSNQTSGIGIFLYASSSTGPSNSDREPLEWTQWSSLMSVRPYILIR